MTEIREATVHVRNTPTDFAQAQRILCRGVLLRQWLSFLPALIVLVGVMLGTTALLEGYNIVPRGWSLLVSIAPAYAAYLVAIRLMNRFRFKSMLDPKGPFLSPTDIKLTADAIHWSNHRGEGRTFWHAVTKVEETALHIYLFVDRNAAHVIPKRDFVSPADAKSFVQLARTHLSDTQVTGSL